MPQKLWARLVLTVTLSLCCLLVHFNRPRNSVQVRFFASVEIDLYRTAVVPQPLPCLCQLETRCRRRQNCIPQMPLDILPMAPSFDCQCHETPVGPLPVALSLSSSYPDLTTRLTTIQSQRRGQRRANEHWSATIVGQIPSLQAESEPNPPCKQSRPPLRAGPSKTSCPLLHSHQTIE